MTRILGLGWLLGWLLAGVASLNAQLGPPTPLFPGGQPVVVPSKPTSQWQPCDIITFTVTVSGYDDQPNYTPPIANPTQYFHGMGIFPGPCWGPITYGTPPPALFNTPGGTWRVQLNQPRVNASGFFFNHTFSGCGFPNPPCQVGQTQRNWGDGPSGAAGGTWVFTWSAQIPCNPPPNCNLSMGAQIYPDGVSGSWTQVPPGGAAAEPPLPGINLIWTAGITLTATSPVCVGANSTLSVNTPITGGTFSWNLDGGTIASGNPAAPPIQVNWPTPGVKTVIVNYTTPGGVTTADTEQVVVNATPQASFTVNRPLSCVNETLEFNVTSPAGPGANFSWNFDGGTFLSGSGTGPYLVRYTSPGARNIRLRVIDGGCISPEFLVPISVQPLPNSAFNYSGNTCENSPITLQATAPDSALLNWDFAGALVQQGGTGPGPHVVSWPSPGSYTVRLTATYPGCADTSYRTIIILPLPVISAGPDRLICGGGNCTPLQASSNIASGCLYTWTPSIGLSDPNTLNPVACPLSPTTYYLVANCGGCISTVDSMHIDLLPAPTATVGQAQVAFCAGSGGVVLPGAASGGTGPLRYRWYPSTGLSSDVVLQPTANPTQNTIYHLVATDSLGCPSDSVPVLVRVEGLPVVNAGTDRTLCPGDPGVQLQANVTSGSGAYSYLWTPATGLSCTNCPNPFCTATQTTVYTVRVTDNATNCLNAITSATANVRVFVAAKPVAHVAAGNLSICQGQSVQIGGLPTGGGPNYSYNWTPSFGLSDPSSPFPIASPTATTTYSVVVFSNGCLSDAVDVTVNVDPVPQVVFSSNPVMACPKAAAQLSPNINAAPGAIFRWRPAIGLSDSTIANPTATLDTSITYTLWVFAGSCTTQASVSVERYPLPIVDADTTNMGVNLCQGDPTGVALPAHVSFPGNYTLQWSPLRGLSADNVLNPIVTPTVSTFYVLTVNTGQCTVRDTVWVRVLPGIGAQTAASSLKVCLGDSVQLSASGGIGAASYRWTPATGLSNPNIANPKASPSISQKYTVTINEGGCGDTSSTSVTVLPQAKALFTPSQNRGCAPMAVSFLNTSSGADTCIWDFGNGQTSTLCNGHVLYTQPGTYTPRLTVFSAGGQCSHTYISSIAIEVSDSVKAQFSTSLQPGDTLYQPVSAVSFTDQSQGQLQSWSWDFGDGNGSLQQSPQYTYPVPGTYLPTLTVTDVNGCVSTATGQTIMVLPPVVEIPNVFTPNNDGINDVLRIYYQGNESYSVTVSDRWGNVRFATKDPNNYWTGADAPDGLYWVFVTIGRKNFRHEVTLLR